MLRSGVDFEILFYDNPQPMFIYDMGSLRFLDVNDAACQQYGYTRQEFLQLTIRDIRPPEDYPQMERALINLKGNRVMKRRFRHQHKNGTVFNVEIISYDIRVESNPARLVMPIDVTVQLQNQLALEQTLSKMAHTLESISDGHFILSPAGEVISWNKSAEALTGVMKEEILNHNFWVVIPDAVQSGFYSQVQQAIESNTIVKFEEYFGQMDKWFYVSIYPTVNDVSIYFQNITEIKKHQQELKLKNRHLEEVAYFNSHELRRPVANIMGLYHLLTQAQETNCSEVKEIKEIIDKIQASCQDIDQVIKRIDQIHFFSK
ncbi:PAS domain S-box protein [Mucilaginibacter koreensis]